MLIIIIIMLIRGATVSRGKHHRLPTREVKEGQDPRTLTNAALQDLQRGWPKKSAGTPGDSRRWLSTCSRG